MLKAKNLQVGGTNYNCSVSEANYSMISKLCYNDTEHSYAAVHVHRLVRVGIRVSWRAFVWGSGTRILGAKWVIMTSLNNFQTRLSCPLSHKTSYD